MDSLSNLDNRALVSRASAGDYHAWAALTDRYTGLLWSLARGMGLSHADVADAVQTTWLRLVEHLDHLRDPEHVGAWLVTTLRRECLTALRRSARIVSSDGLDELPDSGGGLDDALIRDERDAALWRAFTDLPPRCQCLLRVLMAEPPPSYAEVAAALDMRIGSIGPTRQRCLEALRRAMESVVYPSETSSAGTG